MFWVSCTVDATWRVSTPADPWPLQYACPGHLEDAIRQLGGDCRVTVLLPGMVLPAPRSYAARSIRVVHKRPDDPPTEAADTCRE